MKRSDLVITALASTTHAFPFHLDDACIRVDSRPPPDAHKPLEHFLSYSIEFSSLVDFAGNLSAPNTFSDNLLNNIAHYAGSKPLIRVGFVNARTVYDIR